ncbi:MarR family winged helix-turn-helix transcriptional regulator [Parafrankia sp. EUN1f]|uniref:MarR family winged helix-turn-helix transcriptional regulator n=1 Tax=Parafrankia sp. EUN1f TaxID=102897 RepID=UPI0001C45760|nr:MarR family transcriptional regulator [Parafrankia sp. EUN1f]EFC82028.1 transcriptional regulator, MarR family [Parafrankia sp. EUN1f]
MDAGEAMRLNRALTKMSKLYRAARARRLAALGLHPGQDVLLWHLAQERDGMTISELAARLGVEQPTATRSLARLEKSGYFRREPVATDRRQVRIVLLDRGHALLPAVERAWSELAEEAMGQVSAPDREIAIGALEQAIANLRRIIGDDVLTEE